jgi:26S proteasome regulatory subunit N3
MADVEMKPADDKKTEEKKEEEKKEEVPPTPEQEIKTNIALIERAVSTLEPRFTHRVLRTLATLRKKINDTVLRNAVEEAYPKGARATFNLRKQYTY